MKEEEKIKAYREIATWLIVLSWITGMSLWLHYGKVFIAPKEIAVDKEICENPQDWKAKEEFYHCFSKDGRINYAVVKSPIYPTYLPVSGNEEVSYYCTKIDVVNFIP